MNESPEQEASGRSAVRAAPLPPWELERMPTPPPAEGEVAQVGGTRGSLAAPVVRAQPRENGLGVAGIGLGAVGLLLALVFPYAMVLVGFLGLAACVCGGIALRHSVNTGAPGLNRAIAALVLGILTFVAFGASLTLMGRDAKETTESFRGFFGDMTTAMNDQERVAEINELLLPGTGQATVTLDGVTFEIPLDGCGFADPVPGYRLVGRGHSFAGRQVEVVFASAFLGVEGEAVSVWVGARGYVLEAPQLFELSDDGRTLRAAGTFRVPMSSSDAEGVLEATCSA